jgi:hypothetical protein
MAALDGVKHAAAPDLRRREVKGKARVGPGKAAVDVPMRTRLLALFVTVYVWFAKKAVRDGIEIDIHHIFSFMVARQRKNVPPKR